eukprot:gene5654-1011_t
MSGMREAMSGTAKDFSGLAREAKKTSANFTTLADDASRVTREAHTTVEK